MRTSPQQLARNIVEYCTVNGLKGKQRDTVAHAMTFCAATLARSEGQQDFSGLHFIVSVRGYAEVESFAKSKEPIATTEGAV